MPEASTAEKINDCAFKGCYNLSSIKLSKSVIEIGFHAFANTSLTEIELSENIEKLNDECFASCEKLTTFIIPNNCHLDEKDFGLGLFKDCRKFSKIETHSSNFIVKTGGLFSADVTKLFIFPPASPYKFIPIPPSVRFIGNGAFMYCDNILSTIIPSNSVTTIGNSAFEDCKNLHYINIPLETTTVGVNAFEGCHGLICGVDIDSTDIGFINHLIEESKLKKSAIKSCNKRTCSFVATYDVYLSLFIIIYITV